MFQDLMQNGLPPVENNRSIKSIIEESSQKHYGPNSECFSENSDRYSTENPPPQMPSRGKGMKYIEGYWDIEPNKKYSSSGNIPTQLGEGKNTGTAPLWIYGDQTTLPDYSQGKKVSDSFESYKNMLDNNTIPEHTKIQLLQFLKDKYDTARRPYAPVDPEDEEDDDDDDHNGHGKIIRSIISPMGAEKRRRAMNIVAIFLGNKNLIRWNSVGEFTLPIYAANLAINLNSLLRTLVYANGGSDQEIRSTIEIIKPFYKSIKEHIVNRKVLKTLDGIEDDVSKKYIALKTNKKKKKGKI